MQIILVILIMSLSLGVQAETWKVATLEWPPYTCSKCYRNGAAAEALRKVLGKKGISVEFVFYPWVQTQKIGGRKSFVGYFPAWPEEVLPGFMASESLFVSPIVFMERTEVPLKWNVLKDLKGKTFAVTEGYGNTVEFNSLVKQGVFKTVSVLSEDSTIRKLAAGSVDGVLIDKFVGEHYLQTLFVKERDKIRLNPKIIENKTLHLAFNGTNARKVNVLRQAMRKTSFQKAVESYLLQYGK